MPIPAVKSGEDEKEYISRCMSVLATEYDDISQRYAICIGKFQDKEGMSLIKHQYAKKNSGEGLMDAVRNIRLKFAVGVPHYTADGKLYTGPTHKDANGRLMTGATHSSDSEYLYHKDELPIK